MNEKGFFTLIGLCFLLVAALLVRGVQESEKNYSNITTDFHTEVDLQNVADSALIEAVDLIKRNQEAIANGEQIPEILPKPSSVSEEQTAQKITITGNYDADVEVYARYAWYPVDKRGDIFFNERKYTQDGYNDENFKKDDNNKELTNIGIALISVASREIDGNKFYRRAIGYFLTDGDENNLDKAKKPKEYIYFMNSLDKEK